MIEETENEEELLFKPPVSVQYRCPRSPPCGTDAPRATVVCPLGSSARTSAWSPERCLSSKSAQALHRAGKVVMGASRSQAGGRRGERGEALGKGSALSGGTCPSAGGQGHTHLSSALQGQAVKAAAGVWQDRNWASELDSGLRAVSVLGRLLCARGGPGAAGRQPVARDGERKASRRGLVQTGIPSASLPSH